MILKHQCPSGCGFFVNIGHLKKIAPSDFLKQLSIFLRANTAPKVSFDLKNKTKKSFLKQENTEENDNSPYTKCPLCFQLLKPLTFNLSSVQNIELDICPSCQICWMDIGEWQEIYNKKNYVQNEFSEIKTIAGTNSNSDNEKKLQNKLIESLLVLEKEKSKSKNYLKADSVQYSEINNSESFLLSLGLPVEESIDNFWNNTPISNYLLISHILLGILGLLKSSVILKYFSFGTSQPNFINLYSWISSVFFSYNIFQLFFNSYYIWIFADNVEDDLGSDNFLKFLLSTNFLSLLLFYYFDADKFSILGPQSLISACIGFYCFRFPDRKFLISTRRIFFSNFSIIRIPAIAMGFLYFIGNLIGSIYFSKFKMTLAYLSLTVVPFVLGILLAITEKKRIKDKN